MEAWSEQTLDPHFPFHFSFWLEPPQLTQPPARAPGHRRQDQTAAAMGRGTCRPPLAPTRGSRAPSASAWGRRAPERRRPSWRATRRGTHARPPLALSALGRPPPAGPEAAGSRAQAARGFMRGPRTVRSGRRRPRRVRRWLWPAAASGACALEPRGRVLMRRSS